MSVTTFIKEADVKQALKKAVPYTLKLTQMQGIQPKTKRYAMIGTAFDYLLRFSLHHRHPDLVKTNTWVAEHVMLNLIQGVVAKYGSTVADKLWDNVMEAREREANYIENGHMSDDLVKSAILLAQTDPFLRAGILPEPYGIVDPLDMEDLWKLISIVPFDEFAPQGICLLDPTFNLSRTIGGADVDLMIDNTLIDIKTTMYLDMKRDYLNQLIVYYLLSRGGVNGAGSTIVEHIAIYFSRHGKLVRIPIKDLATEQQFEGLERWFTLRASSHLANLVEKHSHKI